MSTRPDPSPQEFSQVRARRLFARPAGPGQIAEGPGYLYRPGQVVVNARDLALVERELDRLGGSPDREAHARFDAVRVPVRRYRMPASVEVPDLVDRLRSVPSGRVPRVAPNHVFMGEPNYQGGPGGPPVPAPPLLEGSPAQDLGGPTVAVLDTGVAEDAQRLHALLAGRYPEEARDVDVLDADVPPDGLDLQAGHGTFIAGVVARLAPTARLEPARVLGPDGDGDEVSIALGLAEAVAAGATVINLSLGGYTLGDMAPPSLESALDALDPGVAVVAAAGNNGQSRPFWPAAFKRVIAVGALDTTGTGDPVAADFSNYGSWVDACAPGVRIHSTYVKGEWSLDGEPPRDFQGYACWSGTSFAAPQVAAAIAARVGPGVSARSAAFQLLGDPSLSRFPDLGVMVLPGVDLRCPAH